MKICAAVVVIMFSATNVGERTGEWWFNRFEISLVSVWFGTAAIEQDEMSYICV